MSSRCGIIRNYDGSLIIRLPVGLVTWELEVSYIGFELLGIHSVVIVVLLDPSGIPAGSSKVQGRHIICASSTHGAFL